MTYYDFFIGLTDKTLAKIEAELIKDREVLERLRGKAKQFAEYADRHNDILKIDELFKVMDNVKRDRATARAAVGLT